ncbi:hypothetical protein [Streptomyces beihaiensis]|uniref:Integral membrane protein n=1 Tax=Streptomyces beihaiensis TaxID=2984495 RepID=A0ABT3TNX7_9ACTN|nr:hypothetical protein [Streptomyces beihaiensis]MCX3058706.1 hypothetical protein [Streptomyces beihaiensis]
MRVLRRGVANEGRRLGDLWMWAARRRHAVPAGAEVFAYAREQAALMYAMTFVYFVEAFGVWVLLRDAPSLHRIVLPFDVYTVLLVLGAHAVCVTRPHVLCADTLRVRRGLRVDLSIPVTLIAAVQRENRFSHPAREGELDLDVGARTSVTLELTGPVTHFTAFGRAREVTVVRLHAEEPDRLVRLLGQRLTRARTEPSPVPDRPV